MDPLSIAVAIALSQPPSPAKAIDVDEPEKAELTHIDSQFLKDQIMAAMALPYKYGVTQLPCNAREMQPWRGWKPAREPAGRIQWIQGPATKVFWAGIYGTCLIQAPVDKEKLEVIERTALECECNGWLPANP